MFDRLFGWLEVYVRVEDREAVFYALSQCQYVFFLCCNAVQRLDCAIV